MLRHHRLYQGPLLHISTCLPLCSFLQWMKRHCIIVPAPNCHCLDWCQAQTAFATRWALFTVVTKQVDHYVHIHWRIQWDFTCDCGAKWFPVDAKGPKLCPIGLQTKSKHHHYSETLGQRPVDPCYQIVFFTFLNSDHVSHHISQQKSRLFLCCCASRFHRLCVKESALDTWRDSWHANQSGSSLPISETNKNKNLLDLVMCENLKGKKRNVGLI